MEQIAVKGTHDIIEDETLAYQEIEMVLRSISEVYSYNEYRTPIIEHSELFTRSVGESSDIVRKEMYNFLDKGGRNITLRPEFTASIVRSIVNAKLYATADLPIKAYYCGPAFRYERPQAGRYRQFNQFGVEAIGVRSPFVDAEVISLGYHALQALGFEHIVLKINTLGDDITKENYKTAIKDYFSTCIDKMCGDCQERYKMNPLRILDCKMENDQQYIVKAPKMENYLTADAKSYFNQVLSLLDELQINYEKDDTLVRGLDYYSDVVFEFHYFDKQGKSIGALGAGGHYDKLVSELGGGKLDGVGLALGEERLYSVLKNEQLIPDYHTQVDFYVMPISENEFEQAYVISDYLRTLGFRTEACYEAKSMKALFKRAERKQAHFAVIIGENEVKTNSVIIKNMKSQEQQTVALKDLEEVADKLFEEIEHDEECHHNHEEE